MIKSVRKTSEGFFSFCRGQPDLVLLGSLEHLEADVVWLSVVSELSLLMEYFRLFSSILLRGALPRGAALGYAPRRGPAREGCSRNPELQGPARAGGGRASIRGRGEGGDGARGVPGPAPLPGAVQPEGPEPLPSSSGRKVTPWPLLTPTKK